MTHQCSRRGSPHQKNIILFLALILLLGNPLPARADSTICYVVADSGDQLEEVDRVASSWTNIGPTGTSSIESAALYLDGTTVYAANANQLGILNTSSGTFTPTSSTFGTGNGAQGNVTFSDVDGLAFDALTGYFYGTERQSGEDLLFRIDRATGAHVPDAFGTGVDYVVIQTQAVFGSANLDDIDDIAIDPRDGQMYGVANNGGSSDHLVKIDKNTGEVTDVGVFRNGSDNVNDMEGLGFYNNGVFYGTTGSSSNNGFDDSFWEIDLATAQATRILDIEAQSGRSDYESVACLTGGANHIKGKVFFDNNRDGNDDGGNGWANVTVQLFRDLNNNGVIDGDDFLVQELTTSNSGTITSFDGVDTSGVPGTYDFMTASAGPFVVRLKLSTLPANNSMTTDNVETAAFPVPPSTSPTFGATDSGNDFGIGPGTKTISGTVFEDTDLDGVLDAGETNRASNVTVRLYEDTNNNGKVDAGDHLSGITTTDTSGNYSFNAGVGNFVLAIDSDTLPTGTTQTTNPPHFTQTASFTNDPTNETDADNDFGYTSDPFAMAVQKTSDVSSSVDAGDTIEYTITVTNIGVDTLTDIVVNDGLPNDTTYVAQSTLAQGFAIQPLTENFADDFETGGYSGNTGTQSFSGPWVELDSVGGSENIKVEAVSNCPTPNNLCLRVEAETTGDHIYRELDLSDYTAASLTFDYDQENLGGGAIVLEISDDGGTSYTTLKTYTGNATSGSESFDISSYAAENTRVRFRVTSTRNSRDLRIDNFDIAVTQGYAAMTKDNQPGGSNADLSNGTPPNLVIAADAFRLKPGDFMTVTFQVQVDNPVDSSAVKIDNSVSVTSAEITTPVTDTHHDPLTDYGDTPTDGSATPAGSPSAYGAPSHALSANLFLGPNTEGTADGDPGMQHSGDASGDDSQGRDDENSVVFSYSADYSQITATVTYNNTTGSDAKICGWLDGSAQADGLADGSFDASEGQCITVSDNSGSPDRTVSFTWDNSGSGKYIPVGDTFARFRISSDTGMSTSDANTAPLGFGEVEDHPHLGSEDYDDLPSGYGDASHALPHVGDFTTPAPTAVWIGDNTGQPDAETGTQSEDDTDGNDDESGVAFRASKGPDYSIFADVTVTNKTGGAVQVCGWLDVPDGTDGSFQSSDGDCKTVNGTNCTDQGNDQYLCTFQWDNLPTDQQYTTYARFRVSSDPNLSVNASSGALRDGEVEGYQVQFDFRPTAVTIGAVRLRAVPLREFLNSLDQAQLARWLQSWAPSIGEGWDRASLVQALLPYLDPDGDGQLALLSWDTLEERGTLGFYVERRPVGTSRWIRINEEMLPGLIDAPAGGQYQLIDPGAERGSYEYRLIEQEARGAQRTYGPFKLVLP